MALGLARSGISDAAGTVALGKSHHGVRIAAQNNTLRRMIFLFFVIFLNPNSPSANEFTATIEINRQAFEEVILAALENDRDHPVFSEVRSAHFVFPLLGVRLWHDQTWLPSNGPAGTRLAPRDSIIGYDHGLEAYLNPVFTSSLALCTTPGGVVRDAPTRVYLLLTREEALRFRGHFEDQVLIAARLNVTPIPDAERGPDRAGFRIEFVIEFRPLRTRELVAALRFPIRSGQINTPDDLAVVALRNLPAIGCAIGRLIS
jgi:hypothetical protein